MDKKRYIFNGDRTSVFILQNNMIQINQMKWNAKDSSEYVSIFLGEDDMKRIKNIIDKVEHDDLNGKTKVMCTYENGDTIITPINLSYDEAVQYFLGNAFNLYDDGKLYKCVKVEEFN